MKELRVLVCAPATAPFTTLGSDMTRFFFRCRVRVMIAPTGQRLLREDATVRIACVPCGIAHAIESGEDIRMDLPGTVDELLGEIMSKRPNHHRYRN